MVNTNFSVGLNVYDRVNNNDIKLKKACDDFESFFIQELLKSGLKNSEIVKKSSGGNIIQSMYIEGISSSGSIGLSSMLYEYLSKKV